MYSTFLSIAFTCCPLLSIRYTCIASSQRWRMPTRCNVCLARTSWTFLNVCNNVWCHSCVKHQSLLMQSVELTVTYFKSKHVFFINLLISGLFYIVSLFESAYRRHIKTLLCVELLQLLPLTRRLSTPLHHCTLWYWFRYALIWAQCPFWLQL